MGRGRDNEVQSFALHEVLRNEALHTQYETHGRKGKPLLGSLRHLAPSARGLSTKLTGGVHRATVLKSVFLTLFCGHRSRALNRQSLSLA